MKKLIIISLFVILGIANINAQYEGDSWLHNELWQKGSGGPILGRIDASKFYFTENGEFYYGGEYSHNIRAASGELIRSFSGMYDYNFSTQEILLQATMLNGRDTLFTRTFSVDTTSVSTKIHLRENGGRWSMFRKKGECTFVMPVSPVLFRVETMNIDCSYPEYGRLDLKDESNVDIVDQKKILNILRHTKYSKNPPNLDEWISKADIIITMTDGGEEFARAFIRKDEQSICVDTQGWISGFMLQYEISETSLEEIIEISKKYI